VRENLPEQPGVAVAKGDADGFWVVLSVPRFHILCLHHFDKSLFSFFLLLPTCVKPAIEGLRIQADLPGIGNFAHAAFFPHLHVQLFFRLINFHFDSLR